MSNVIRIDSYLSFKQVKNLIRTCGPKVAFLIEGEPGIGKSELHYQMEREDVRGEYEHVYIDCPTVMEGSLAADIPRHDEKALVTYLSARLKLASGKPIILMLDEFLKTNKLLKVLFTRLILEQVIGDTRLPAGSIVFATSNNASDGVNDTIEAHVGNRVTRIKMAKPTAKEWNLWAGEAGVSALIRSWVALTPRCMASYLEANQEDNPFIFNPRRAGSVSFVTPRSLYKADAIIRAKTILGDDVTAAALCGTLGQAAGTSMAAFLQMEKDIIPVQDIIKNPSTTMIPDNPGALLMTLFNAVDLLETQDDLCAFMGWVNRIQAQELQGVFFTMLIQSNRTAKMAMRNSDVQKWAQENFEILN